MTGGDGEGAAVTARVLVLAGRGRYEDPWHDHAATSHAVAGVLGALDGVDVQVRSVFRDVLDGLDDVDLLVLNAGTWQPGYREAGIGGTDADWAPFHARLDTWARAGGRLLALHQAANAFGDAPRFEEVLGGRWVEGVSGHPPLGRARLRLASGAHPLTERVGAVEAIDERYCGLRVAPSSQVLGWVDDDAGDPHPALWVTEAHGGRTVYSALGHDVRSFASPSHQELLRRAATWLLA
ncbi:ThuA domain-containing protein [Xylanimonas oleitrophica]|uniref:ThuA domain-containing protein n=1 Tax=Xylanimonas oleitrophica TaxID=2607479 RepID=A0A2W5WMU0_9MICO|nr:ThuA domain-containing protein [Xylanimonas oleitrophica]PZR52647.1 ThuA domain-containing protein [Xylanimonas oleitrophica]